MLYVLVGINRHGRIAQWGPTSHSRELLRSFNQRWDSAVVHVDICPVKPGFLLRVSARSLAAANRRAGLRK